MRTQEYYLNSNFEITIREAATCDAEKLLHLMKGIMEHDETVTRYAEEFKSSVEDIKKFITKQNREENNCLFVAMVNDKLIGMIDIHGQYKIKTKHSCEFGLSVSKDYRNKGVGRRLLETVINWAKRHDTIEKVCLGVMSNNLPAIAIYEKLGFVEEGLIRKAYKLKNGTYLDEHRMALFV